jgi:urease accessory protein
MDDPAHLLSLLHFADGAFPAGGYAHSLGLEAACQAGLVRDRDGVERFLRAHLEGASGPCDATAAAAALQAFRAGDLQRCRSLDEVLEAMKPVRTFREASRQMGRQTLRVAAALTGEARLAGYLDEVNAGRTPGHHAVVLGMTGGALGWEPGEAAAAYLYATTALLVGAALRLLPLGQLEGQRTLWALHPLIARLGREAAARDPADLWSFTPGLDLQGARHERLEARLFRS